MTEPRGEIYDIGYRHYDGPREGRARARMALWMNGVRTALGLGRGWPSKVLPIILFLVLTGIAVVFVLVGTTLGAVGEDIPGHPEFYQGATIVLILFSAIIAPELLTADRRNGVISLYLVRPLTTTDYVIGRWLAFFTVILAVVFVPQIVLFIGLTLGASDPLDHLREEWLVVPRFLGAGFVLAVFITTLPLSVAAFTTRRAYAAAFVIGLWVIGVATGNALVENISGSSAKWFALIDIGSVPIFINNLIFDKSPEDALLEVATHLPTAVIVGWYLVLTAGPALALLWRYRRITI